MTQGKPDKPQSNPKPAVRNQGEGDKESAARYNADLQRFVNKSQVEHGAREAAKAIDGREGPALRKAEAKGKARAKEDDPEEKRDYRKPS